MVIYIGKSFFSHFRDFPVPWCFFPDGIQVVNVGQERMTSLEFWESSPNWCWCSNILYIGGLGLPQVSSSYCISTHGLSEIYMGLWVRIILYPKIIQNPIDKPSIGAQLAAKRCSRRAFRMNFLHGPPLGQLAPTMHRLRLLVLRWAAAWRLAI